MTRRSRYVTGIAVMALPLLALVLAIEAVVTVRRQYAPAPDYVVEGVTAGDGPTLRVAMLGDSTVAGLGAETVDESLAVQTADRVADATGRRVDITGHGVSGAKTADVRDDQLARLAGHDVDVVVIVVGSNDVTHGTSPQRFTHDTRSMLEAAADQVPDAEVVLGGIPLFGSATAFPQPLRAVVDGYAGVLRSRQRSVADPMEGVTFVDIASEASPRFVGVPEAMSDGFHPSAVGYGFWADALARGVVDVLRGR